MLSTSPVAARAPVRRSVAVQRLGRIGYADALAVQHDLVAKRSANPRSGGGSVVPDTLLLLEHSPVITLGRGSKEGNVLLSAEALRARGVELHESGRGGDVTYHGPGQVVGYAIVDLKPDRCDVRRFVGDLEETMIRCAADYGLAAGRSKGMVGAWIGDRKIGAIGVRISRWVTMHGFAFNVSTNMTHFDLIVPCGIPDRGVTSLERELGRSVPMDEVMDRLASHFADVFDADRA